MRVLFLLIISVFSIIFLIAGKPSPNKYVLAPGYTVEIDGTSNLHNWKEKVEIVEGNAQIQWNKDKSFDINTLDILMQVRSIKSDKGSVMNNNTYKALKADEFPEIVFTILTPVKSIRSAIQQKPVSIKGNLTIAGVKKPLIVEVKVFMKDQNKLTFEGSCKLKMTDFNVEPPGAFFGTLKTGNDIVLSFKTSFIPAPGSQPHTLNN